MIGKKKEVSKAFKNDPELVLRCSLVSSKRVTHRRLEISNLCI